jgi:hypothetical protein
MKSFLGVFGFLILGGALLLSAPDPQDPVKKDPQDPVKKGPQDPVKKGGKKGDKSGPKKVELAHGFFWAGPDALRGDWQGEGFVAQIVPALDRVLSVADQVQQQADAAHYQANIFKKFDVANDKPVAVMQGDLAGDTVTLTGDGWTGTIVGGHFKATNNTESFDLQPVTRTPPSLGAKPPAGAVVLFDGSNMNAWAKMKEKDWLTEDGPSQWRLVPGGAMEVVPRAGSLISHKWFGDAKIHVEFRNLGGPTNSGVYIQDRYEANINEMYGRLDGNPCAGFDNSTPADAKPGIRASRPPLAWQTFDIDFHAPKFDATGNKTADARVTLLFNGTTLYDDRQLGPVTLNAARLGEAPTGPIQLQEHGMPVQFRNIWVLEGKK